MRARANQVRKFRARWWVIDPNARYNQAIAGLSGDEGLSVRFVREPGPEDVRYFIRGWFVALPAERLLVQ